MRVLCMTGVSFDATATALCLRASGRPRQSWSHSRMARPPASRRRSRSCVRCRPAQHARACARPGVSERRDRVDEFRPPEAVRAEKAQLHPEGARLTCDLSARSGCETVLHPCSGPGRLHTLPVVAESREQPANMTFISLDGRVPEAAMASKPVQQCIEMLPTFRAGLQNLRRADDFPVREERGKAPEHRSGAVGTGEPDRPVGEPRMNAGTAAGEKAATNGMSSTRDSQERSAVRVDPEPSLRLVPHGKLGDAA